MNALRPRLPIRRFRPLVPLLCGLLAITGVSADEVHQSVLQPGGMPGLPVIQKIERVETNQVEMQWDGPSGLYRLMHKLDLRDQPWTELVPWSTNHSAVVEARQGMEFFRVIGPSPSYAGAQSCEECHSGIHAEELATAHAHAFETLQDFRLTQVVDGVTNVIGGWDTTNSCLRCHTVGRKPNPAIQEPLPTGFVSASATPHLAGVQCENCHGPAALHVAAPFDLSVRPRVDIAAQVCGGCHQSVPLPQPFPRPTLPHYEDWNASGHAEVLEELKEDFEGPRGESVYIPSCGRCHSGSVRQAQFDGDPLPDGDEASAIGIVCTTCHDPHETHVRTNVISGLITTNQLRYPTASLEEYHDPGGWDTNSANINLCAQCHNDRGAVWNAVDRPTSPSTRAPHHSPQYNMLLATVGILPTNSVPWQATHGGVRFVTNTLHNIIAVTNQCVTCHVQTEEHQSGPPEVAANTGHQFNVESYKACLGCHQPLVDPEVGEERVRGLVEWTSMVINEEMSATKALLDHWAAEYADDAITNYGTLAWEYRPAGDFNPGESGPTLEEQQTYIPAGIQMARFNLYVVRYDGSMGVHNPLYALDLLWYAQDLVSSITNKPASSLSGMFESDLPEPLD